MFDKLNLNWRNFRRSRRRSIFLLLSMMVVLVFSAHHRDLFAAGTCAVGPQSAITGLYQIRNSCAGTVLDVTKASVDNGAAMIVWDTLTGDNQRFTFDLQSDGSYRIVAKHSGKVVDVPNSGLDNGLGLLQWEWNGGDNQRWQLQPVGSNGQYRIVAKHSGKAMSVQGNGATGSTVQQGEGVNACAAIWELVPAGSPPPPPTSTDRPKNDAEANRFLTQATFGAKRADIERVKALGYAGWMEEQFNMPVQYSHYTTVIAPYAGTDPNGGYPKMPDLHDSLWISLVDSNDQLRQRMMFALSQIFVVSLADGALWYNASGTASYIDMLYARSFDNFRDLLESVSKSSAMGLSLSFAYNKKENPALGTVPDQNYAREVMQLFSIGLWELNLDGTRKLDVNGKPIPTYGQRDIQGISRVLTGWTFDQATPANWDSANSLAWGANTWAVQARPMKAFPAYHSTLEKNFLGITIPATSAPNPDANMKVLLDRLFNHPNVGPFIGKQLIQRFVTSNPSPGYVTRVASAFNNNGSGVRGDMKAVLRAIFLDAEARDTGQVANPTFGKLREPVVRLAQLMRTLNASRAGSAYPNSYMISSWPFDARKGLWQNPLGSPTVFNFYRPDYSLGNTDLARSGLVAPEMQITHASSVDDLQFFFRDIFENQGITAPGDESVRLNTYWMKLDYSELLPLVSNPPALAEKLNQLFVSGQMTDDLRGNVIAAMNNTNSERSATSGVVRGVQFMKLAAALYTVWLSPEYVVQK